jgi:hypothetical protein
MKEPDPLGDFKKLLLRKRLEEIVAIPTTLYFPAGIVAQLKEICEESGYTPGQLVVKALKGQIYHWDKFYQYVTTPPEKPEDFIWPEDPLFCLACASTVHFIDSFTQSVYDPIAFRQQKEHAPAEWSFSSFEEQDEVDPAAKARRAGVRWCEGAINRRCQWTGNLGIASYISVEAVARTIAIDG